MSCLMRVWDCGPLFTSVQFRVIIKQMIILITQKRSDSSSPLLSSQGSIHTRVISQLMTILPKSATVGVVNVACVLSQLQTRDLMRYFCWLRWQKSSQSTVRKGLQFILEFLVETYLREGLSLAFTFFASTSTAPEEQSSKSLCRPYAYSLFLVRLGLLGDGEDAHIRRACTGEGLVLCSRSGTFLGRGREMRSGLRVGESRGGACAKSVRIGAEYENVIFQIGG